MAAAQPPARITTHVCRSRTAPGQQETRFNFRVTSALLGCHGSYLRPPKNYTTKYNKTFVNEWNAFGKRYKQNN